MPVVPAIKGKIGNIEYYQCIMSARDLVARTRPATEHFSKKDWEEMGPWGRNQREVSDRYLKQITPYLLRDKDRFFNSFIVLLDKKLCEFKSVGDQPADIAGNLKKVKEAVTDFTVKQNIEKIGFLTILDEKGMCILDGQHRMKAIRAALEDSPEKEKLRKILQNTNEEELLKSNNGVENDTYSVIFVAAESKVTERKLFTDINTYAKPIGKKELVMLSETNGFYKIAQKMAREKKPFHSDLYYMDSTALPDKAAAITTLHHMSVMVEKICQANDMAWNKQVKQSQAELDKGYALCTNVLGEFFSKIDAYKFAISKFAPGEKPTYISGLRNKQDSKKWGLLFKPLPQLALLNAILLLTGENGGDLDKRQIFNTINDIDWSYDKGSQFQNMVITPEANILTGSKIHDRLMYMICFWILGEKKFIKVIGQKEFDTLNSDYQEVNITDDNLPKYKKK